MNKQYGGKIQPKPEHVREDVGIGSTLTSKNDIKRTRTVFNIMSASIHNFIYNTLHTRAISELKAGNFMSTTDAYVHFIGHIFIPFVKKDDDFVRTFIRMIVQYYVKSTSLKTITFNEVVNKIAFEFIPNDFYDATQLSERINHVGVILRNVTVKYVGFIMMPENIHKVIDVRNQDNSQLLCTELINILHMEQRNCYLRFVRAINPSLSKEQDSVDPAVAVQLRNELIAERKRYNNIAQSAAAMRRLLDNAKTIIVRKNEELNLLRAKIRELEFENKKTNTEHTSSLTKLTATRNIQQHSATQPRQDTQHSVSVNPIQPVIESVSHRDPVEVDQEEFTIDVEDEIEGGAVERERNIPTAGTLLTSFRTAMDTITETNKPTLVQVDKPKQTSSTLQTSLDAFFDEEEYENPFK